MGKIVNSTFASLDGDHQPHGRRHSGFTDDESGAIALTQWLRYAWRHAVRRRSRHAAGPARRQGSRLGRRRAQLPARLDLEHSRSRRPGRLDPMLAGCRASRPEVLRCVAAAPR